MIARLEVTRGSLTEYPLAEKVCGGWQNGVMFYPDAEVTKVTPLIFRNETPTDDEREDMIAFLLRDHNFEESPWGRTYTDAEIANTLRRSEVPEPSTECPQCHRPDGLHKLGCGERFGSEPQGEPSDAEMSRGSVTVPSDRALNAALATGLDPALCDAMWAAGWSLVLELGKVPEWHHPAALRAAGVTRG